MSTLKKTDLLAVAMVVADKDLLRVSTIKKKFVEQMPKLNAPELKKGGFEIVGHVSHGAFFVIKMGRIFAKTHWTDLCEYLRDEMGQTQIVMHNDVMNTYPQLFED
jgi:hypothetical protein